MEQESVSEERISQLESLEEITRRTSSDYDEADLDYEPAEDTDDDEHEEDLKKQSPLKNSDEKKYETNNDQQKKKERHYLSSEDDDDIEVLDVIDTETVSPKDADKENKETRVRRSRSSEQKALETKKSVSPRKRTDSKDKDRSRSSRENYTERKYTFEDLEKVRQFFTSNQKKRKATNDLPINPSNKKWKENDNNGVGESKDGVQQSNDDWLKAKLEREGKVFIKNFIAFPNGRNGASTNFKANIQKAFQDELNADILTTLTPAYCGLCFKDFDDDITAWKHYTGSNHRGTIKRFNRGTYKGHPPFWRMVHERLCTRSPESMGEKEIYDQVVKNYNVGDNLDKVKILVRRNIDTLIHYDQVGSDSRGHYFVKNHNVQEVRKIFENYFFEKKRQEEQGGPDLFSEGSSRGGREERFPSDRSYLSPSEDRRAPYPSHRPSPYSSPWSGRSLQAPGEHGRGERSGHYSNHTEERRSSHYPSSIEERRGSRSGDYSSASFVAPEPRGRHHSLEARGSTYPQLPAPRPSAYLSPSLDGKNTQHASPISRNSHYPRTSPYSSSETRSSKYLAPEPRNTRYSSSETRPSSRKEPQPPSSEARLEPRKDHQLPSPFSERRKDKDVQPGMMVVDPSKLRMLPNGQILIKQDDVVTMRQHN